MAQDLADLGQPGTGAQHLGGGGMPQAVRVRLRQASPGAGGAHDRRHATGRQATVRSANSGEDLGALAAGPTSVQPANDGVADIDRQGQSLLAAAFAPDYDLAGAPVDVAELQCCHLTSTKPQAHQHSQDREVAPARRAATVTACQQACHLLAAEHLRQTGKPPSGHLGHRGRELAGDLSLQIEVAKQRAQPADHVLGRADLAPAALGEHEVDDLARTEAFHVQLANW